MKRIAIREDFNVSDVSDEEDVQTIVDKINIGLDTDIQLDLSGCLIDYPATSKLVDTIMEQLSSLAGDKKLQIITDYILPMTTVINWVLLGSNKLDMLDKKELPLEQIIQIIRTALRPFNITLTITIRYKTGKTKDEQTISDRQS
jgi:hypothetical protein